VPDACKHLRESVGARRVDRQIAHQEADRHPDAADDQTRPASKSFHEVKTRESERHVDSPEND